ncbi:MAG TPA: hypothetical protein PKH58_12005, partial [Paludibacteraceae bacterium]|nr:hypothetical protein [Paludibacteraceae bacterium]
NFLLAGLFVISVGLGQAQTDIQNEKPSPQTSDQNINGTTLKITGHSPSINDPDYEAKKQEWIKNYPEEYKQLLESNKAAQGNVIEKPQPRITYPEKVATHAPELDDPRYDEKKQEWVKNYPEEYKSIYKPAVSNAASPNSVKLPQITFPEKVATHAPEMGDVDYQAKKEAWIKNYPEEYKNLYKSANSKSENNNNAKLPQITYPAKVAAHAPEMNDPDYYTKKIDWMKNYPQEYEQINKLNKKSENRPDQAESVLDYGKGGIFEGRKAQQEVVSQRNETSKHFHNADGTVDAIITAGMPLNYQENGFWKTIRKEITPNSTGIYPEYDYCNTTNTTKTFYSGNSAGGMLTEFGASPIREWINPQISWVVNGALTETVSIANVEATVNLNKVIYSNCFSGTDVRFTQENGGKKLDIILNNSSLLSNIPDGTSHLAISETVLLPDGWSHKINNSNIYIINEKGLIVFSYAAPEFYDNKKDSKKVTGNYKVEQNNNELIITTLIPIEWLTSAERIFPIIIDPTATIYATNGGWQCAACASPYIDDVNMIFVGDLDTNPGEHRGYAKFNTSSINDSYSISSVTMALNCLSVGSSSATTIYSWSIDGTYGPYTAYDVSYYNDFGAGSNYNSYSVSTTGLYGPTSLGSSAASTLQAQLPNDRFQVGLTNSNPSDDTYFKIFNSSSYIVVTYNEATCTVCPSYDYWISPSGSWQTHSSSVDVGGCKLYEIYLYAGVEYQFSLCSADGGSAAFDSYLTLYDNSCTSVASNDDYCGVQSYISYTPTTSGYYYLQNNHYSFNGGGSYTLAYRYIADQCTACPSYDTYLSPTGTYQTVSGSTGMEGCDMYEVYMYAGVQYRFTFCEGGGAYTGDTYLELFDYSCNSVASNDDFCGLGSQLDFTPTTSGTYLLRVRGLGGAPITYTLAYKYFADVCTTCPSYDAYISPTSTYQTTSESFGMEGCHIYEAYLYANTQYRFTFCEGGASYSGDPYLELYNGSCSQVAYNDDFCSSGSQLDYTPGISGYYYLKVRGWANQPVTYTLAYKYFADVCTACPSYDATITPTSVYQTTSESFGMQGCQIYQTYLTAYAQYRFTFCEGGGSYTDDPVLEIYDASCNLLTYNDDYCGVGPQLDYIPTYTGTYYVKVRGFAQTASSFTLAYKYICNNPCDNITPMTCGTTYTGTLGTLCSDWSTYTGCGFTEPGEEIVYSYTPPTSGNFTFNALNVSGDPDYFLMSTCSNSGTNIYGNCWGVGSINVALTGGVTYYIIIDNYSSSNPAQYSLSVDCCTTPSDPVVSGSTTICSGESTNISATSTNATTIYWYTASCGGTQVGTSAPGANFAVSPTSTTTYYARGFNSSGSCWSASCGSATITVNSTIGTPTVTGATSICPGDPTNLSATSTNASTIYWYTGSCGGTQIGTSTPGANFWVSPATTNTYYARGYNSTTGCWSAACGSAAVTVNSAIGTPTVTGTASICFGESTNLSATSTNASNIYWYTSSCGGTSVGTSTPGANFAVSPATTTTYYARGFNSSTGCWSSGCGSVTITVTPDNTISLTAGGT